jgi:hypothetical protein
MRGLRASGTLGDVNADGIPELIVGIQNGGLRWFNGTALDITNQEPSSDPVVAPNPVNAGDFIGLQLTEPSHVEWFDAQGRLVQVMGMQQVGATSLPAPATPGLYFLTTQPAAGGIIRTVQVVVQ